MKSLFDLYCINVLVNDVKTNSKEVFLNDAFVCVKGVNVDRHQYINEAIKRGASFLIVSKGKKYPIPYVKVKNTNKELINILSNVYSDAKNIGIIAITGTDGKTTTASIIRDMIGYDYCGYIGTNGVKGKYFNANSENTTPAIEYNYKYLDKFAKEKLKYATIEASSEGMLHKRLEGFKFKIGILTNFTEDHLNVHKTLKNYLKCKKKVFHNIDKDGLAILNMDDKFYKQFRKSCNCSVVTYGKNKYSTLRIIDYELFPNKTRIKYMLKKNIFIIESPLVGEFNVYNLSAAILTLLSLNYNISEIRKRILNIKTPYGRCEFLNYNTEYKIFLDYAHTVNGIKSVLTYLNSIKKRKIITVIGSAGGREKEKRPSMGKVAQNLSDIVIYTMDDPRYEKVLDIVNEMVDKSKRNYLIEIDRKKAIHMALEMAQKDDIVAILGKGRDNYMAIFDKKILYSDLLVLDNYFKK